MFIGLVIMLLFAVGVYRFANSRFNDDPAVASSATSEKSTPSRMIKDDSNFVRIPAGEFMMGSEYGSNDERPVHQVKISRDFELGRYEVTQAAVGNREGK